MTQKKSDKFQVPYMKRLFISALHGERDITLNMQDGVTIISSDNGVGKTTTLNILYYILSVKLHRLAKIDFKYVELNLSNGESLRIDRHQLEPYSNGSGDSRLPFSIRRMSERIGSAMSPEAAAEISSHVRRGDLPQVRRLLQKYWPLDEERSVVSFTRFLIEYPDFFESAVLEKKVRDFIKFLSFKLVYLPTYRRVEEDLSNLGLLTKSSGIETAELQRIASDEDVLIHFGMDDVTARFKRVTQKIKDDTMASYSKISGGMLDELLNIPNFAKDSSQLDIIQKNKDALSLVLKRIGTSISDSGRARINDLVDSGKITEEKHQPLAYFLGNLIKIYEAQRAFDDRINNFVDTANDYLGDKVLVYDEVDPKIDVVSKKTQRPIDLEKLSSGEKQLISILSLLYLEEKDFGVIFDEPELSLSTDWQEKLLPDIMKSGQCKFLLAATHSPYIHNNEFARRAKPIKVRYVDGVGDE